MHFHSEMWFSEKKQILCFDIEFFQTFFWCFPNMTHSNDSHWQIVSLIHIHDTEVKFRSELFGPNPCSIQQWCDKFLKTGTVRDGARMARASRHPPHVLEDVDEHVKAHPTFCIEELQQCLHHQFSNLRNTSKSTICRALNFDLQLTRKKLTKAAREAVPEEAKNHNEKLKPIHSHPQ